MPFVLTFVARVSGAQKPELTPSLPIGLSLRYAQRKIFILVAAFHAIARFVF